MGSYGTNNPVDYLWAVIRERWIGVPRATKIGRHFKVVARLQGTFWPDDHHPRDPDAYLCLFTGPHLDAHDCIRDVAPALLRLREADPPLANFVYYALVDSVRRVMPVYDWRTAQEQYERQWGAAMTLGPGAAGELGLGRVREGEPKAYIFDWLLTRRRRLLTAAEIRGMAAACRDSWARKVTEAALLLEEAAAAIPTAELRHFNAYPRQRLGNVAGLVEAFPGLIVTATEHEMDPTEGMGREYMRQHSALQATVQGPAKALRIPSVCLPLHTSAPQTLHAAYERFGRVCQLLERAANLLDLLAKWERKRRHRPEAEPVQARIMVTVNGA